MRSLIIGGGEVGSALAHVLGHEYPVDIIDTKLGVTFSDSSDPYGIMHVCIPYTDKFEEIVRKYQEEHKPKYTIIHSTVPPGTSRMLNAVHSPVIGIHPNLEQSLVTFVKYLSGEKASEVADYFRRAGMKIYLFDQQETTEVMKILDTTFYGLCVEYTKNVKTHCEKYGIPFEAWTLYTDNYNAGYNMLGHPEYTRPNLVPIKTPLGGHCVKPNAKLMDTTFTRLLDLLWTSGSTIPQSPTSSASGSGSAWVQPVSSIRTSGSSGITARTAPAPQEPSSEPPTTAQ